MCKYGEAAVSDLMASSFEKHQVVQRPCQCQYYGPRILTWYRLPPVDLNVKSVSIPVPSSVFRV